MQGIERIDYPIRHHFHKKQSWNYNVDEKICRKCNEPLPKTKSPFGFIYTLICPKCGTNN